MVTHTFKAKSYEIFLARYMIPAGEEGNLRYFAYIVVNGDDGHVLTIKFLRPDSEIVENYYNPNTKDAKIYIPPEQSNQYVVH